jgi:aminopeptidase YwaD
MLRMTATTGSVSTVDADPGGRADALTRMRAVIEALAGARFAGRRVGTPGGRAAADWLAAHVSELGASTTVDGFELPRSVREVYATPTLRWSDGDTTVALTFRREFCEHLASADRQSVHSGRIVAPNAPVAGAWVLDGGFSAERVTAWAMAGAVGVLVPRGTDEQGWMPKMIAGPAPAALPVLAVRSDIHRLMTSAASASTAWVAASAPIRTSDVTAANVYGQFRPVGPNGLAVLLTAHFDGVGDDPDGTRFPAAADNASGVAVVIEAARHLHRTLPPSIGLAVALLDAEEIGAHGSAHHAPHVTQGTYVINIDGAAALHEAAAVEAGGPAHSLLAALDQAGRATGVALKAGPMPSDNRRYAAAGLSAIGIGMGIPCYQTPAETADRVEADTLDAAVRLIVATAENIASTAATN